MVVPGLARAGGEFGKKLAKPHENKPWFVLVLSVLMILAGRWVKKHAGTGADAEPFLYWLGIALMGFALCATPKEVGRDLERDLPGRRHTPIALQRHLESHSVRPCETAGAPIVRPSCHPGSEEVKQEIVSRRSEQTA